VIPLQERVHAAPKPDDWQLDKLHQVFRVRHGNKNTGMKEGNLLSLSYGRIVQKDIETADGLLPENFEGYQIVEPGNIVLRLTDLQNDKRSLRQGLATQRGIITSAYDAVEVQRDNDPRFWFYSLLALDLAKHYYSMGGGVRQSVKFADFPNDWVYRPNLTIQRQIADFLDRETERIDLLIEKKQRLVALLGERLAHLVRNLITRGTTNNPELVQTDLYWCPLLPKNWQVRKGFHIGRLVGSTSGEETEDGGEAAVPYIKVADLNACDGDRLVSTKAMFRPQSAFRPQPKDFLVFPKRGAAIFTNKVAIAPANSAIDPNLMGWVIFAGYEPEYFMWVLKTRTLDNLADVSTVPQINNKHIYPERFPVPPTEEQKEIVEEIARVRSLSFAITERNQLSIDRLKEYRSALITAAVTGQIDVSIYAKSGTPNRRLDAIQEEMGV
jgi:type I restriction enzyme S subunit